MNETSNVIRDQVFSLPTLLRQQYNDLEPKTRKVLTTPQIFSIQRIVLTGCGDSYAAGMAMQRVFERLTRLPVELVTAVDLARFYNEKRLGDAPNNPLVIAVSNSGSGARVGEAVQRARKHKAFVLGVTKSTETLLGQNSDAIVPLSIPSFPSAPGTRSYLVSLLALLLLAIRIGEVRGCYTMDHATSMRKDILDQADRLEEMLPSIDMHMLDVAKRWKHLEAWDFVGAGSDYATAWFGQAKVMEATGQYAMHINSEEWLHLNFFMRKSTQLGTVVVASADNAALSRTKEMLSYAKILQRPLLLVTDSIQQDVEGTQVLYPARAVVDSLSLFQFVPISLLVGYVMQLIGEEHGRGCTGLWEFCQGGAAVKNSAIEIL